MFPSVLLATSILLLPLGQDAPAIQGKGLSKQTLQAGAKLCRDSVQGLIDLQDSDDGSWQLGDATSPPPVAVTALAVLALMSCGEIPGRTKNGRCIERGILYLLSRQDRRGGKTDGYIGFEADRFSRMHGHGYATLALAEALGMLSRQDDALLTEKALRDGLVRAVHLIENTQERETGGWYYDPVPTGHEGSMTICMVQALRAAKNAGIRVDPKVIHRAVQYVERSQKPDGSFRYKLGDKRSSVALTAAAVATLEAAGAWKNPVLIKGQAYLVDKDLHSGLRSQRYPLPSSRFPYYERLYIAQALFFAQDLGPFRRWYTRLVEELGRSRDPATATWTSKRYSRAYATAMNLLVLSIPQQFLPIHQR